MMAACQWWVLAADQGQTIALERLRSALLALAGTVVVLAGLTTNLHLNGRRGTIQPFEPTSLDGSVPVLLDDDATPKRVKIAKVRKA